MAVAWVDVHVPRYAPTSVLVTPLLSGNTPNYAESVSGESGQSPARH